jgi:hypothetical protein
MGIVIGSSHEVFINLVLSPIDDYFLKIPMNVFINVITQSEYIFITSIEFNRIDQLPWVPNDELILLLF